ncbi:MAG: hypothetical protein QXD51_04360 [Candidatus Anstonellales archaeon]
MEIEDKVVAALIAYENARLMDFEKGYTQDALGFIRSTINEYERSGIRDERIEKKIKELKRIVSEMQVKVGAIPSTRVSNEVRVKSYLALIEERKKAGKQVDDIVDSFISFFSSLPPKEKEKFKEEIGRVLEDLNVEVDVAHEYVKKAQVIMNAIKTFKGENKALKKKALEYLKKAKKIREEKGEATKDIDALINSL